MSKPTVFISYSHKDEVWKDRIEKQLQVLQFEGVLETWTDRQIVAGDDWFAKIEEAMNRATVGILLITADSLTSDFILREEVATLIQRRDRDGLHIFPVIVRPCPWQEVGWLSRMQCRPNDGRPLSSYSKNKCEEHLSAIAVEVAEILRRVAPATSKKGTVHPLPPEDIALAKLPSTGADLFGRDEQLAALDDAWVDGKTNIVTLVAFGGVGKSALVNVWLRGMREDGYRGARRVYGWSFYSQGTSEDRQASGDEFLSAALLWFGEKEEDIPKSPWDRGERLAQLCREHRTLLILDGLEPLQHPPGEQTGKLRDPGVQSLLRELAVDNPGLCMVSTRITVDDLKEHVGTSVQQFDLDDLSPEAGGQLLASLGIKGPDDELQQAARDFGGHALALTLLGTYLGVVYNGDLRMRSEVPALTLDARDGGHAKRVMKGYERWFAGKPELCVLRMLGLFDRPAVAGAIEALRADPPIMHLTDKLAGISEADWKFALHDLRDARLLSQPDPGAPDTLDCHPHVREHFGAKLKKDHKAAWRAGHDRLFDYFRGPACPKELPDTLQEMAPLFAAVHHGCRAGRYQDAIDEVYLRRIQRGNDAYSIHMLGAIGANLSSLSGFFERQWLRPVSGISDQRKAYTLNGAGYALQAMGRLREAVSPTRASAERCVVAKQWKNAAIATRNLSQLLLALGDTAKALNCARGSVELADWSRSAFERMAERVALAGALLEKGRVSEAEETFRTAERMQKERQPQLSVLYSLQGYLFCDLLLGLGRYAEVSERAIQTLTWASEQGGLLDIALDHLSLGRAVLMRVREEGGSDFTEAERHLRHAVNGLREAGQESFIPLGLLARAELHRVTEEFPKARRDLNEVMKIATRSGMRLFEADAHLEYARLHLAMGNRDKARASLAAGRKLVDETGYHRRDAAIKELEKLLG